ISSPRWERTCRTLCRRSLRSSPLRLRQRSKRAASLLVAVEPPDALLTTSDLRLSLPGKDEHPQAEAPHTARHLAGGVHPRLLAHRAHLIDLHLRPQGVVDSEQRVELLTDGRLGERAGSIAIRPPRARRGAPQADG